MTYAIRCGSCRKTVERDIPAGFDGEFRCAACGSSHVLQVRADGTLFVLLAYDAPREMRAAR